MPLTSEIIQPLEHLEIAPREMRSVVYTLIEKLPTLFGDHLYESLSEPLSDQYLTQRLYKFTEVHCVLNPSSMNPSSMTSSSMTSLKQRDKTRRATKDQPSCEAPILISLASQLGFIPPKGKKIKYTLKEATTQVIERFTFHPKTKLAILIADYWDHKLMMSQKKTFEQFLSHGQVFIPTLHHGGLLTPICYL